jgi:hypothetical protein
MAGVFVIDIADEIRFRLGEPTLSVLNRRFGPEGRCLTCCEPLGALPLSVRAYRGLDGITLLMAYHAACAPSEWIDTGHTGLTCHGTWEAAVATACVPVAQPRWLRVARRPGTRDEVLPVMFVHPSREMTRVRQVGLGEAVNADLEYYHSFGFGGSGVLRRARRCHSGGRAQVTEIEDTAVLQVTVAGQAWAAPASDRAISLAVQAGGVVAGITYDRDPGRLAVDDAYFRCALGNGDVFLSWISLAGRDDRYGSWPRQGRSWLTRWEAGPSGATT